MKNNALMAKLWPVGLFKPLNYLGFILLLFVSICIGSCKKDLLVPSKKIVETKEKIQNISYNEFLSSINLDKMGSLKPVIANAGNAKNTTMSVGETGLSFVLDMGNVKKLVLGDTVSYVLALKPKTPRAIHFENITIQTVGGNTTAFLTTYIPTKEWIADWHGQKHLPFKGEIYASRINLADFPQLREQTNTQGSQGKVMSAGTSQVLINNNKISLLPGECEIYDVYVVTAYPCKYGHWTRAECNYYDTYGNWEVRSDDYPPGYNISVTTVVNCAPPNSPPTGDGGGGGGGGTTPNPPGGYDPCGSGTPMPVVSKANGNGLLKLAGVPPTDCDGGTLPPVLEPEQSFFYSDEEVEEIVNTMADPITGNGIELYLILKYRNSKTINMSRYSVASSSIEIGDYTLTPHYDQNNKLVFYAGSRLASTVRNGIEYIIRPDQVNNFRNNVKYYTSAADLVYMNGIPDRGMIQMMSGDRISGLLNLWGEALKSPFYWSYLIDCFLISPSHPNVRSAVEESIPAGASYTKSTLEIGQQMHRNYKLADVKPGLAIKEYRLPSGKRIDFLDIENATIYELKPNNPRQITAGNKQLQEYLEELQRMPQFSGINWKKVLDLY
ncbi:hypothetical protein VRU48_01115 [Pedobacter sp. KR3-3]|uniref:Tox-REase-9 domain-containing protein n=1 Tax=Pedobacter albus TaxID=3113905 RepID=A0ABU7I2T5_9SPHI|nr:hypothetical protein [Pedobacter sp. KR3-3]MEE1943686.1 hypothetical protein [Pedobacter sp. KR3-3]